MKKIELKHLAPYLPYRMAVKLLNYPMGNGIRILELDCGHDFHIYMQQGWVRPILRPLTDIFNDKLNPIPINELQMKYGWDYLFYDVYKKKKSFNINEVKYACLDKLFEWHFDVFGLIDLGLAIDINTLTLPLPA